MKKPSTRREEHRLGDVLALAEQLRQAFLGDPGVIRAEVCGSVRRFCEVVGDIDLVVSSQQPGEVLKRFSKSPLVAHVVDRTEQACTVRLRRPDVPVDVHVVSDDDFAIALHQFTGSGAYLKRFSEHARSRGFEVSARGLFQAGAKTPLVDEIALYEALGLTEVPPEAREVADALTASTKGEFPAHLVTGADIRGVVHCHTTWSDGRDSLEAMARAARIRGMEYMTVTEHSPSANYAGGLTLDKLKRQWDAIAKAQVKIPGIRLLKGIEVDILEDGALDLPDSCLEQLDVVIASIHVRHGHDERQMTARLCRALAHPRVQILGHPTGRLLHERDAYAFDLDAVLEAAAEHGVAVEVNGNPLRLDLSAPMARRALERGVRLVASADAHSVADLDFAQYSVGTLRKAWARPEEVLNTLPVDAFLTALRPESAR
ncbi:MAG: DNA polymerase/3'-5' exonuclease PolX [Myxococcaceae bacterium]